MARIIFDTVAIADSAHHFDVEMGALDDALCFDDFSLALELALPPVELFVNALDRALFLIGGGRVGALGLNLKAIGFIFAPGRERISPVSGSIFRMAVISLPQSSMRTARSS